MPSWYHIPSPETAWLVEGLITADGHASICGKPKSGKSTFIRNLIVAVVKGRQFLGRSIDIPTGTGKVLYVHLDRKDQPWRVAKELKYLGITPEESARIVFRTAQDIPSPDFNERLAWLTKEVSASEPHLIVIDLLWQFVVAKSSNDYNATLQGINTLQDALIEAKYTGALVVALHGRKSTNPNEPFDDVLGSTGQRGSFSTNILLTRYRKEGVYTVQSDQTERDEVHGELNETVVSRNQDGTLHLGSPFNDLVKEHQSTKSEVFLRRILTFISQNPGCEIETVLGGLGMSKKTFLKYVEKDPEIFITRGQGKKGDPLRYYVNDGTALQEGVETSVN